MKMSRCERRCEDEQMFRRCEDEKMFYRPPLLEEPCAQTLSGKTRSKTQFKTRYGKSPASTHMDFGRQAANLPFGSLVTICRIPAQRHGSVEMIIPALCRSTRKQRQQQPSNQQPQQQQDPSSCRIQQQPSQTQ